MSKYDDISSTFQKGFDKLLPIPKTPRTYQIHFSLPNKTVSWLPHGTLGKEKYEQRLKAFADYIESINAKRSMKFSSRGWGYILEGLGKITKNEFDACEKAINDCRKIGLLDIDFIAEDQDETRRFSGIIQATNRTTGFRRIKTDIEKTLRNLAESATDFWKGEQYYLMMCVEKGDLKNLFEPICKEYHVPIISSKGWSPIHLRADIADLASMAESKHLTPVLLLFYDHDPEGLKICERFRKNLEDIERGTLWNPENLLIERFGLNAEDIDKYGLTWIDNLESGSGRESKDYSYIDNYGKRKCEANALFKNDETFKAAETICRKAIEKFYGEDALERFGKKEEIMKKELSKIENAPMWQRFYKEIDVLIEQHKKREAPKVKKEHKEEKELDRLIDDIKNNYGSGYSRCPKCFNSFKYTQKDIGTLVRCRYCNAPMRLKVKEELKE